VLDQRPERRGERVASREARTVGGDEDGLGVPVREGLLEVPGGEGGREGA
jgi:hypothetical protein